MLVATRVRRKVQLALYKLSAPKFSTTWRAATARGSVRRAFQP